MNQLINLNQTAVKFKSSRELAEECGIPHETVKEFVHELCTMRKIDISKIQRTYKDNQNQEQIEYLIDKEIAKQIVIGFIDKLFSITESL